MNPVIRYGGVVKKAVLLISFVLCFCSLSFAFDGNRKGFVLGGGGGLNRTHSLVNDRVDVDIHYIIGYGANEKNIFVFEGHNVWDEEKLRLYYGHGVIIWYHYFSKSPSSYFIGLGIRNIYSRNFHIGGGILMKSSYQLGVYYNQLYEDDWFEDWKITFTYIGF